MSLNPYETLPPIKSEEMTNYRKDYVPYHVERPQFHQPDQYQKPEGNIDGMTSYNKEYTPKHGAPAQAIKPQGQRAVPVKFEGEPTYRNDYRKWSLPGRQNPYGSQPAWIPPTEKVQDMTTFRHDYPGHHQAVRQSFKPNEAAKMSDAPFEDSTSHRQAYVQHAIPPRFQRERETYQPSRQPMNDISTFQRDYKGAPGGPMQSFKPQNAAFQSDAPFKDDTTQRVDFRPWEAERPYVHVPEQYQKPEGMMDMNTVHKQAFVPHPIEKQRPIRPATGKRNTDVPFDDSTNYNNDFRAWQAQRVQPMKPEQYVPNTGQFEGSSTYQKHYRPHAAAPTQSFKPNNTANLSGAPFEGNTMYQQEFTPKPIQVCDAAVIDQPQSKYKFVQLDSRGHKRYLPQLTTITPLGNGQRIQSPQRLQALSMA